MVKFIKTMTEFTTLMETSKTKLVVIDFTATWCGPCKMIAPVFEELASNNTDVEFVKIDVDEAPQISSECNVRSMPTFMFYKDGQKVHEFSGASTQKLTECVAKYK